MFDHQHLIQLLRYPDRWYSIPVYALLLDECGVQSARRCPTGLVRQSGRSSVQWRGSLRRPLLSCSTRRAVARDCKNRRITAHNATLTNGLCIRFAQGTPETWTAM